jgi:SNF2 family DNA or RNA helicase
MTISRVALYEYLDRPRDSFLWMKDLSRRTIMAELDRFSVKPRFKTQPWMHQLVCFYIGLCHPEFLFLLDMGLGKSKIVADLITHRLRDKTLRRRALITVPNVVNMASWEEDLVVHSDLEPWTCAVQNTQEKWERLADPEGDVTIIDYHGLTLALCEKVKGKMVLNEKRLRIVRKLYGFVDMDESHKLRNHQNLWFAMMREITHAADFVYANTGTPFSKDPEAMWSQFYLVDRGETFGENLGLFRESFFGLSTEAFGKAWVFNKRTAPELHRMMQHRSIRYDEDEVPEIDLPKLVPLVRKCDMSEEQREHYLRAVEGLLSVQGTGDAQAMEAPWIRMRQISSGYLVWKDEHGDHLVRFKENPKLDLLEACLNEVGDKKAIIVHYYQETGRMLMDKLAAMKIKAVWLYGGTKDKAGVRDSFLRDPKCQVLVMNTETGGTGNDGLQKVSRYMFIYEGPTPPDTRKQVVKRIHRPGQRERAFVVDLVLRRSTDQGILDSIAEGEDLFNTILNGRRLQRSLLGA